MRQRRWPRGAGWGLVDSSGIPRALALSYLPLLLRDSMTLMASQGWLDPRGQQWYARGQGPFGLCHCLCPRGSTVLVSARGSLYSPEREPVLTARPPAHWGSPGATGTVGNASLGLERRARAQGSRYDPQDLEEPSRGSVPWFWGV